MTSQTGQQKITIHILANISQNKSNQTMKFGQLTIETLSFKNHAKNEVGRLVLCFLKKLYMR